MRAPPAAETFSDILLVLAPLWILRNVRTTRAVRFRLISIFTCSLVTTIAALAHAITIIKAPGIWEAISGALEAAIALGVCNLSVIVPAFVVLLRRRQENDDDDQEHTAETIGGFGGPKGPRDRDGTILITFTTDPTISTGIGHPDADIYPTAK